MSHELPTWATELRPHQEKAIAQILDHYANGVQMVVLDAPTGSGKTLIADVVRQELEIEKALYVCSGKSLQAQFARDFPESRIVMGRKNYRPNKVDHIGEDKLTCDDCLGLACGYCHFSATCPYKVARDDAMHAKTAVMNTAYYLNVMNGTNLFEERGLTVFDECDTLEGYLLNWANVNLSTARLKALGLKTPKKSAHWPTVDAWVRDEVVPMALSHMRSFDDTKPEEEKELQEWERWLHEVRQFLASRADGEDWAKKTDDDRGGGRWMRLNPVMVDRFGRKGVWRHARKTDRWLLMSATVIDARVMLENLGWAGPWERVVVDNTFPVKNRPIYDVPIVALNKNSSEEDRDKLARAVRGAVDRHRRESVLVHSVSYDLTRRIVAALEGTGRSIHFYANSDERDDAVDAFRNDPGSVMVAPSLDRGYDFPEDVCRVQIIAKVPYPFLGDERTSARLNADGGQDWYDVQTIRTLVQMTGRAVRSADDTAVTYILDWNFNKKHSKRRYMFPAWWSEAVSTPFQPLDLLKPPTS